ncbi:hypothetical protein [Streptomyces sp. NPDC048639]|uniref:hypothetical protein n=1 Tax=Streptomyces sp. NPDC048639 TaxID=3365581 RepID=UPI0037242993
MHAIAGRRIRFAMTLHARSRFKVPEIGRAVAVAWPIPRWSTLPAITFHQN